MQGPPPPVAPSDAAALRALVEQRREAASMARAQPAAPAAAVARTAPAPMPAPPVDATAWASLQAQPASTPPRARAGLPPDVAQAIDEMLRTGATGVPDDDPVQLRVTLLHGSGAPLGLLELGRHSLRWTPSGARAPRAFSARVEPALSLRVQQALAP